MPVYEFICEDCKHKFDGLYPMEIKVDEINCPKCNKKNVKKLFSAFAVRKEGEELSTPTSTACSSCSTKMCSTCGL